MKKLLFIIPVVLLFAVSAFTVPETTRWIISPDFSIAFSSRDPSGEFKELTGEIIFDPADLAGSRFTVKVSVDSIDMGIALKNKHARSEKWFDSEKYPFIVYTSKSISKTEDGFQVAGDLEMHGIKKECSIPFRFEETPEGAVFTGAFTVNRNDFGIGKPGGKVSEILEVSVRVPVVRE